MNFGYSDFETMNEKSLFAEKFCSCEN